MTEKTCSILDFPIQSLSQEDIEDCEDCSVKYWQGRYIIIRTLNRVAEGLVDWTPEMSDHLQTFNRIAKEWGFIPLEEPIK